MVADTGQRLSGHVTSRDTSDGVVARLRLIGQMEAWTLNSESILPAGRKTRALMSVVALSAPRPALRGRLAEMLWSRRPEEQARASLRQEIHRLQDLLTAADAEILSVTRDHISLRPGMVWVDVEEIMRFGSIEPSALGLLGGDLLEGLDGVDPAFDNWLATERERVRDRARSLVEALLKRQEEPEAMIRVAQQLLDIDRAHEGAWRALMRAHAARGERGMAIQAYQRCRAVLIDLLDAAPSLETQRLLAEIRGPSGSRTRPRALGEMPDPSGDGLSEPVPLRPEPPMLTPVNGAPVPEPLRADGRAHTRGGARVGVLPLQIVGGGDETSHLASGLADEITTALARFRWMFLVSSATLARFAAESRDEAVIRRRFGLDFLLDGTMQHAGTRMRITVRLIDLRAGSDIVWTRRFDRQADDLLSLQDEIAAEVVGQIDPEILLIESKRVTARPPQDPTAYDLLLRSLPLISRMERQGFLQAGEFLRQSIALEPDYAAAHAWAAYWNIFLVGQGWATNPEIALAEAGQLAERAVTLDPFDARALTIAGHVRAFLHRRLREANALHERALSINPNLAMAWALSGATCAYLGDLDEAERRVRRYKSLSPLDPHAFVFDTALTFIHLLKRDYEAAVAVGRQVSEMNASFSNACKPYLAALGFLGRTEEAASVRRRLLSIEPKFSIERFLATTPFDRAEDRNHFAQGLRLAGIKERDSALVA
jgi:DNA-binding SARP family transcriptional activator/TolB-like protein